MVTKFIPATAPAAATAGSALPKTIIAVQLQRHVPDPASAASRWTDRPVAPDPMKAMRRIRGCCTSAPGRRARPGNHRDQARRLQLADAQRRQARGPAP